MLIAAIILPPAAAGFQVRTFADASTALTKLGSSIPDLLVVDVIMPGLDGFEFCRRLRQLPGGDVVPVLMTTSLDDTVSINQAYQAGATNFATKPVNWTIEVQRLRYLLKSADLAAELQKKEQETRLAKEDWERTFNSIADGVVVLDSDMTILRANHAAIQLHGGLKEAIIGKACCELYYGSEERCPNCPAGRVLATGLPASAEINCPPEGRLFEITVSPMAGDDRRISRMVHVARDLTEKKKLETELRQAQKMEAVGTLAGGIAHDFNNLLTVIQCCAELSLSEETEVGRSNENLEAILEAARRGSSLAKQLLLFSRKKGNNCQKQLLDLNALLKNMRKMLEKGLSPAVAQQYKLAHDLNRIQADSGQLEQIVMNLAVNAGHAMPAGGTLAIETRNIRLGPESCYSHPDFPPGDYVLMAVSDTGHGMDKETLSRIYEPFFTTKKVGEGTGLGLSVVFGILQEHKGYIDCRSEVGVGTTFSVYLPAAGRAETTTATEREIKLPLPGGSETILVVDDEPGIRRLLERHLVKVGYQVVSASDGEAALQQYSQSKIPPQGVILDLGMPRMSGWECLEKLRQINPGVKVLVASGYGGADLEERVLDQGAKAFLRKPYDLPCISQKLREILDAQTAAS